MKNRLSIVAIGVVAFVLVLFRSSYPTGKEQLILTRWDAFGYYMYNPSIFIYNDVSELKWVPEMDSTYDLTGGELYQASQQDNGKYVNKYLQGVSIMQLPFFFGAHLYAGMSHYKADGFSPPYQYALALAAIFYCLLGLIVLRSVLLRFFSDHVTTITLLFVALGTNLIQYSAIDGAQSHIYIFPLYALILWLTIKWHESPRWKWAFLIGCTIGLATIGRPTELIMLFIPLLWNHHSKEAKSAKWQLVKAHKKHIIYAVIGGFIAILPQLIYWKITSGSFIYNVGSKWMFFNPWFRVLFGIDNGFFIYTPITIFFVLGFFFMKRYPFQRSVLVFCLLNIWIIIAWSDWRYGSTFSTRAMVQSYPVFALALAAFLAKISESRAKKALVLAVGVYLIGVNFFQIPQYNSQVINYRDMSWTYYSNIYLNPDPTPLDMSLLDCDDYLRSESGFRKRTIGNAKQIENWHNNRWKPWHFEQVQLVSEGDVWIKVEAEIFVKQGYDSNYFTATNEGGGKSVKVRLHNPITRRGNVNKYAFYMHLDKERKSQLITFSFDGLEHFQGVVKEIKVTELYN